MFFAMNKAVNMAQNASKPDPPAGLPPWIEPKWHAPSQKYFYINHKTKKTSWEPPVVTSPQVAAAPMVPVAAIPQGNLPSHIEKKWNPSANKFFYINHQTKTTSWDPPADVASVKPVAAVAPVKRRTVRPVSVAPVPITPINAAPVPVPTAMGNTASTGWGAPSPVHIPVSRPVSMAPVPIPTATPTAVARPFARPVARPVSIGSVPPNIGGRSGSLSGPGAEGEFGERPKPSSIVKEGWIKKSDPKGKKFQKRFFRIKGNGFVYYYKKASQITDPKKYAGYFKLEGSRVVRDAPRCSQPFSFAVVTPQRTWILVSENTESKEEWLKSVNKVHYWIHKQ